MTKDEKKNVQEKTSKKGRVYKPYPEADEKYDNGHVHWQLYNKDKYHDPLWSPDKE